MKTPEARAPQKYSDIEVLAEVHRLHKEMGYHNEKPAFSISAIIEELFPEVEVEDEAMEKHAELKAFPRPLANGKQAKIIYNKNDVHSTHRFSIAHELGHWIFDCRRGEDVPSESPCTPSARTLTERRANFFAAELVMPLHRLDEFVKFTIYPNADDADAVASRDRHIQRMAAKFNVSNMCARRRVFDLHAWRRITR